MPPGAEREEDREHDRELLGQHRHRQRDAGEQALHPVAARQAVDRRPRPRTERAPADREVADQRAGLALEQRPLRLDRLRAPCRSCRARCARRSATTSRDPLPLHHERARVDERQVVAARAHLAARPRRGRRASAPATDSPVSSDSSTARLDRLEHDGVGRDAVALGEHDEVAAHDLAARDAPPPAVADDERARARQVAQRLERPLGLPLLEERDAHDDEDEGQQQQRPRPGRRGRGRGRRPPPAAGTSARAPPRARSRAGCGASRRAARCSRRPPGVRPPGRRSARSARRGRTRVGSSRRSRASRSPIIGQTRSAVGVWRESCNESQLRERHRRRHA